jgi:hypothetical protein
MSKGQLVALWKECFGLAAPQGARRDLLTKFLAYKLQEQAYGGLDSVTRKRLRDFGRKLETNPNAELSGCPGIKPGTQLIRDWRGESHRVTVLESGFEYAGKRFSSLSKIARAITGTRWSGPLFFGLRNTQSKEPTGGQRS